MWIVSAKHQSMDTSLDGLGRTSVVLVVLDRFATENIVSQRNLFSKKLANLALSKGAGPPLC